MRINQIEPWIGLQELWQLTRVVKSTFVTEHDLTKEFESSIKKLTGAEHAVSITNGTLALVSILQSLGVKPGDEVIVPDLTFVATSNAVLMVGATPIFCDITHSDWGLDLTQVRKCVNEKTKAIIAVHLLWSGHEYRSFIKFLLSSHNIFLIEDAAQGVGVKLNNRHVGTFGCAINFELLRKQNNHLRGGWGVVLINNSEIVKIVIS